MVILFLTKRLMHDLEKKLKSVQYNAIREAIKGSSRGNLYQELGLQYQQ